MAWTRKGRRLGARCILFLFFFINLPVNLLFLSSSTKWNTASPKVPHLPPRHRHQPRYQRKRTRERETWQGRQWRKVLETPLDMFFLNYFLLLYYASRLTERKTTTTTNDHQNHTPTPTPLPPRRNNNVLVWHKEELAHGCTTMNTKETA